MQHDDNLTAERPSFVTHLECAMTGERHEADQTHNLSRAVRESGGFAIAVDDEAIQAALDEMAREEGLLFCPEGAATYAAYKQSLADGRVKRTDQVMLFNCASGLKYPLPRIERKLDRHQPIDYAAL